MPRTRRLYRVRTRDSGGSLHQRHYQSQEAAYTRAHRWAARTGQATVETSDPVTWPDDDPDVVTHPLPEEEATDADTAI